MADATLARSFVFEKKTVRHHAVVRVTHWITALCFLALAITGAQIVISHPRFYWGETGNVLTPALFELPIPASRSSVKNPATITCSRTRTDGAGLYTFKLRGLLALRACCTAFLDC